MLRLLLAVPILALFAAVLVGGHLYLHRRLVLDPAWPEPVALGLAVAGGLLFASLLLQPVGERTLPPHRARWIAWPASLWMGFAFLAVVALGALDALRWLGIDAALAAGMGAGEEGPLGARVRSALAGAAVLASGAWALRQGLAPPGLREIEVPLAGWPRGLDGLRVAQISDIHIGPILGRDFAESVTARVNALAPDLVAVTGDLVDGRASLLRDEVAPFAGLRAPCGVFFVTGNHDHYSGADSWSERVRELGMRVLRNEHVVRDRAGARFVVAGVDDHRSRQMPGPGGEDLDAALAGRPEDLPLLLLAHDPTTFVKASGRGAALQLSGHTHGGQIWPFSLLVRLVVPFVAGLYRRGDAALYVSRGTGFWGPPMRLGAPAEITLLVLRSREGAA